MIKAVYRTRCLRLTGHAGAGDRGRDIVCAAASILITTLAQVVTLCRAVGELAEAPGVELSPGQAEVSCCPGCALADAAFVVTLVGFRLLAAEYPTCVEVSYEPMEPVSEEKAGACP